MKYEGKRIKYSSGRRVRTRRSSGQTHHTVKVENANNGQEPGTDECQEQMERTTSIPMKSNSRSMDNRVSIGKGVSLSDDSD